eukprot:6327505-Amphidinium_carterae.2
MPRGSKNPPKKKVYLVLELSVNIICSALLVDVRIAPLCQTLELQLNLNFRDEAQQPAYTDISLMSDETVHCGQMPTTALGQAPLGQQVLLRPPSARKLPSDRKLVVGPSTLFGAEPVVNQPSAAAVPVVRAATQAASPVLAGRVVQTVAAQNIVAQPAGSVAQSPVVAA